MKEILEAQYNQTTALLSETRANIKLLMDRELELQSRMNALEDLARGEKQRVEREEAEAKKAADEDTPGETCTETAE